MKRLARVPPGSMVSTTAKRLVPKLLPGQPRFVAGWRMPLLGDIAVEGPKDCNGRYQYAYNRRMEALGRRRAIERVVPEDRPCSAT